ncbi:Piso0_005163 [Millerozyma farinosa CBS 7064]|uniref:DNA repair and recombination protein RAD52 n=1 Tax=Pichia sorbitophila (strain ATCC MYA-4447 / BCRC 22081 / CBS 7064 / NBRC 10061 / NRRL Y-12695) TaxID=559304 RepID=G8Y4D9_PICSO|nr:Piso0_005163 [Millerozyma farinosa CBS 7064]
MSTYEPGYAGPGCETIYFPFLSEFEQEAEVSDDELYGPATEWARKKIGSLQTRLEKLERRHSMLRNNSARSKIPNYSSRLIIQLANEVFGYDGWSSQILSSEIIVSGYDESRSKFQLQYSVTIKIILKDGTSSTGVGVGKALSQSKHLCYNKSKKEAIWNGIKSSIMKFDLVLQSHEEREKGKTNILISS